MQTLLDFLALPLSYLFYVAFLGKHAARMAAIRIAAEGTHYELKVGLKQELAGLRAVIRTVQEMELEAAEANLALKSSRAAVVTALLATVKRIRKLVGASFQADTKLVQQEDGQHKDELGGRGGGRDESDSLGKSCRVKPPDPGGTRGAGATIADRLDPNARGSPTSHGLGGDA